MDALLLLDFWADSQVAPPFAGEREAALDWPSGMPTVRAASICGACAAGLRSACSSLAGLPAAARPFTQGLPVFAAAAGVSVNT